MIIDMEEQEQQVEENVMEPTKYDKYRDTLHRLLYKILGDYVRSQSMISDLFGYDLVDIVWQVEYDNLNAKLRKKYDAAIEQLIPTIGLEDGLTLTVFNPKSLSTPEMLELKIAYDYIQYANRGDISEDDEGHIDIEHREDKYIQFLSDCDGLMDVLFKSLDDLNVELKPEYTQTREKLKGFLGALGDNKK